MTTAAELADDVRRAVADQPYEVVDETPDGFTVQIDVVDARWWTLLRRAALTQVWRWQVRVRSDGTYTVTDRPGTLAWEAGLDSADGSSRPVLRFRASGFAGTAVSLSTRQVWAIGDDGRFGKVVDYSFDPREGRDLIDALAERRGLQKKLNTPARIGLFFALLALGGLAVGGIVVLVLALTGRLG